MQRIIRSAVTAAVSVAVLGLALVPGAGAAETTAAGTTAEVSPLATYDVGEENVYSQWDFGGGTIYYPEGSGTFGAVAISPGYTAGESSMAWYGPALASQGIIAFTIDTLSRFDQPGSRGDQLLAALDYLTEDSDIRGMVDESRLGVMGHSMGGGGTLEASADRPSLKAAVALTPWNLDKTWGEVQTPTLIIGAESDTIASVSSHSIPFYNSLPGSLDKAYLELNNASHFAPNYQDDTIETYTVAWLKVFLDGDSSYESELCPGPGYSLDVSDYRSTCPF